MDQSRGRNIVVFCDGTGQRGGIFFDECRSNVYKLYRACRAGPDSAIDPQEQLSIYDGGVGSLPRGEGWFGPVGRTLYNITAQATGLGVTKNIIRGYASIVRHWRPGDRIFLIGFSRGAFTARGIAAVLGFCGVPTRMPDGSPLRRDEATCARLATEAVKRVYQHVNGSSQERFVAQRDALAERFRETYGSGTPAASNAAPHFVGVFDTVASLANRRSFIVAGALALATIAALALLLSTRTWIFAGFGWELLREWVTHVRKLLELALACSVAGYLVSSFKFAFGLKRHSWWSTLHLTGPWMQFHNRQLGSRVGWARQALSIDEMRTDFVPVPWDTEQKNPRSTSPGEPPWLVQMWFAGCHSDIGGSYPEHESRLSDIALKWLIDEARTIPDGLKIDASLMRLNPCHRGVQHDEARVMPYSLFKGYIRTIDNDALLHPTVEARFGETAVPLADVDAPYRPEALRGHDRVKHLYPARTTGAA